MSIPKVEYNAATQKYKSRRFNQTNSFQLAPNWSDQSQKKEEEANITATDELIVSCVLALLFTILQEFKNSAVYKFKKLYRLYKGYYSYIEAILLIAYDNLL